MISNLQKVNNGTVNVFYSTPTCYTKALHQAKIKWPTKSDDFFPYADKPNSYWTGSWCICMHFCIIVQLPLISGYFTSRPSLKYHIRQASAHMVLCKQLDVLARLSTTKKSDLEILRRLLPLFCALDASAFCNLRATTALQRLP